MEIRSPTNNGSASSQAPRPGRTLSSQKKNDTNCESSNGNTTSVVTAGAQNAGPNPSTLPSLTV